MNKRICAIMVIPVALLIAAGGNTKADKQKVSEVEQRKWIQHIIPLPHEISIPEKMVIDCKAICVKTRPDAGEVEKNAVLELEMLFKNKAGLDPSGKGFEIVLGVVDKDGRLCGMPIAGVERLRKLPNHEQAYTIRPVGENRLALAALDGRGVFYAVTTLLALLEPVTTAKQIELPLMTVTDWPDFAERGLWNGNAEELLLNYGTYVKLNYAKLVNTKLSKVSRDGNHATFDTQLMKRGRLKAARFVPYITHLNFLHRKGLFDVYPELHGKGDSAFAGRYHAHGTGVKAHPVPCASNPLLTKIITEWMMDIAAAGAPECSCWLTERPAQCGCPTCMREGQFVQEARAFVAAWKEVRKKYPDFGIRLFLSTPTEERYDVIYAELPDGVKIERACEVALGRERNEPRDTVSNKLLDPLAAKGLWVATFDVPITANGKVETPEFKLPESSAIRIHNFVRQMARRKYSGVYGMLAFDDSERICGLNIAALAEWGWNVNGRNEKEFVEAWATRAGYEHPEKVAEWSEIMGPIEFDVYDSGFPECYSPGDAVKMIQQKKKPELGKGMFRYYADKKSFDAKIAACQKALEIAKKFKDPYLARETAVVLSYARMAQCIYRIADKVSAGADKAKLTGDLAQLEKACNENVEAIKNWQKQVGPEPWHHRTMKAIAAAENLTGRIEKTVKR